MHLIKKYANRKLYHTNRKQYITLEGIAHLIQAGQQVQVIDNESGKDITGNILAQVISQVREHGGYLVSPMVLTNLIRFGGNTLVGLRRVFFEILGGNYLIETEIHHRLNRLVDEQVIDQQEATRLQRLLLPGSPDNASRGGKSDGGAECFPFPPSGALAHLHQQLDALVARVEQMIETRPTNQEPPEP
ncbi:MAG: pesticidal protein Cry15Aa [Chloroflexaceae bacterium]|nr:pesticidal protein Cry15Aa [Chloroflexaceae bacterium]